MIKDEPKFAVIFDIDGVLVNSNPTHFKTWQIAAQEDGFDFTADLFQRTFGQTSRSIIENNWPKPVTQEKIIALDARKENLYHELAAQGEVPPIPGAIELIRSLDSMNIPIAVGSSGPKINVDLIIRLLEIGPLLKAQISGSDVKEGKPAPDIFLKAAEATGLPPAQCVAIDDSESGVLSAKAAGMKCIGFFSEGHLPYEYEKADRVVHSFNELSPELLQDLWNE